MEVKEFVAISGMPGVYKIISGRSNGLIIEDFDTKERQFVPNRQHQFSPFETIAVFTNNEEDSMVIGKVFAHMHDLGEEPVSEKASSKELREYFTKALPNHDRDRVHTSDIKKIIKWYKFLNSRDLLKPKVEEAAMETAATPAEEAASETSATPAVEATAETEIVAHEPETATAETK